MEWVPEIDYRGYKLTAGIGRRNGSRKDWGKGKKDIPVADGSGGSQERTQGNLQEPGGRDGR